MNGSTRRGFLQGVGAAPFAAAGFAAGAGAMARAAENPDPWSYVDPELAAALRKFPQGAEEWNAGRLAALRAADKNSWVSSAPELQPRKMTIPGPPGQTDVPVLAIDPHPERKNRPALIYIHGGGFIVGHAETNLRLAQKAAQATGAFTVSVDYALSPEAHFPVALEQCYAALAWLHRTARRLGVDRERIAVFGDSAGGGLAAMLAIAARERGQFKLAYQCLLYPVLDDRTGSTRTMPPYMGHFVWTPAANRFAWSSFLGMPPGSAAPPPGAVPARVKDLSGLPPTFIGVGSIDLFCEEDIEYARRLAMAGVRTELLVVPGAYHGFDIVAPHSHATLQFETVWQSALARGLMTA